MLNRTSTTAIARTVLLAGILLAFAFLASRSFFPAFALEDETIEFAENGPDPVAVYTASDPDDGDTLDWSIVVTDAVNLVDTDGDDQPGPILDMTDGVLSFINPPDYENPWFRTNGQSLESLNTYAVIVTVSDDDPDSPNDTTTVTIKITNVDESGTVSFSTLQPLEDIPFVATLTDPDGKIPDTNTEVVTYPIDNNLTDHATTTWQWARSMDGQTGWTDITATSSANEMIDISTRTPESGDVGYFLRATATYTDGFGEERTAAMVSAEPVVKNLENDPPVFQYTDGDIIPEGTEVGDDIADNTPIRRELAENSAGGAAVGAPVVAYDEDGDVLTYELAPTGAYQSFAIDRKTGQISLEDDNIDLDHDQGTPLTYTVTVIATDPSDRPGNIQTQSRDSVDVNIAVTNVPEAPSIADETQSSGLSAKDHLEKSSTPPQNNPSYTNIVSTYSASDDEDGLSNTNLMWSLGGNDKDRLELDSTTGDSTQLRFVDPQPDFDEPADSGRNNVYNVVVTVTDSADMTDTRAVAVTIINVEETGSVELSHITPEVGTRITATLTDPDKSRAVSWQWYVGDTNTEAIGSGAKTATYTPTATDTNSSIIAKASYTDGHGPDKEAESRSDSQVQADQGQDAFSRVRRYRQRNREECGRGR